MLGNSKLYLMLDFVTFGKKPEVTQPFTERLLIRPLSTPLTPCSTVNFDRLVLAHQKMLAIRRNPMYRQPAKTFKTTLLASPV